MSFSPQSLSGDPEMTEECGRKKRKFEVESSDGHMPDDIMLDILTRLPPKSLFRFKCVCKDLRSLFQDEKFLKTYSDCCHRRQEVRLFGRFHGSFNLFSIDLQHATAERIEFPPMIAARLMEDTIIPSCNGLFFLLVSLGIKGTRGPNLVVWDPMADEVLNLPKPDFWVAEKWPYYFHSPRYNLGIGFDTVSNRYKLVAGCPNEVHVFTLGVDQEWRTIQGSSMITAYPSMDKIIYLNGAFYWFNTEADRSCRLKDLRIGRCRITAFNLHDETFSPVPLPLGFVNLGHWLCESQGCLWLVAHDGNKLDLWWLEINSHDNIQKQWVNLSILLPFELLWSDTVMPVRHGNILVQHDWCFYLCCYDDRGQLLKITQVTGLPPYLFLVSKHEDSLRTLDV